MNKILYPKREKKQGQFYSSLHLYSDEFRLTLTLKFEIFFYFKHPPISLCICMITLIRIKLVKIPAGDNF